MEQFTTQTRSATQTPQYPQTSFVSSAVALSAHDRPLGSPDLLVPPTSTMATPRRNVADLARGIAGMARRQPALFIGATFVAGLLVGRFMKASAQPALKARLLAELPAVLRTPTSSPKGEVVGATSASPRTDNQKVSEVAQYKVTAPTKPESAPQPARDPRPASGSNGASASDKPAFDGEKEAWL